MRLPNGYGGVVKLSHPKKAPHAGAMTLTERVYTHLDIHELIEAIDKI